LSIAIFRRQAEGVQPAPQTLRFGLAPALGEAEGAPATGEERPDAHKPEGHGRGPDDDGGLPQPLRGRGPEGEAAGCSSEQASQGDAAEGRCDDAVAADRV
jgi:hypothetical protein